MNQITRYHHLVLKTLPHGQRAAVLTKDEARNERFSNIDGSDSRRDLVLVKKESFLQTPDAPSFQIAQHVRNNDGAGPSANLYGLWAMGRK